MRPLRRRDLYRICHICSVSLQVKPPLAISRHASPRDGLLLHSKKIPELWRPVPLVISMKTYWFNQNRLLSPLRFATALLLACFGAVFISVPTPAAADTQVPFNGIVSGNIISTTPLDECHLLIDVVNGGNATQLGRFTGTAQFILNVCDLSYIGTYEFTGANGDSISGSFIGQLTPTGTPGVFDNDETAFITSGTGRFAGATGTFHLGGQIDTNTGTFALPWQGTISTVGSNRRP